jgi:O-methyltransferase
VSFMMTLARRLLPRRVKQYLRRTLVPTTPTTPKDRKVRAVVEHIRDRVPLNVMPTFAGDSLVSWHNAEFLNDEQFKHLYEIGVSRHSWDPSADIRWRFHVFLWAAARAARLEGDFVECGVNRGGFSRAVVEHVDFGKLDKTFYLMDTFNGIVEDYLTPEERARGIGRHTYANFTESYADVQEAFSDFPNVVLVRGPIPDTLPQVVPDKVAYLLIDMNVVVPEIAAAEHFWDRLVSGAVMILDDYGHKTHALQKTAFDAFARERSVEVLMLPTGHGLIFKP